MRDSFLHCAQPDVQPNFLRMSCEFFMFRCTGRSSTGKNGGSSRLNIGRGTSGKTSLKTPEGGLGEPLIASRKSNVVYSGIAFTALDLITRPSPFRATKCSSVWKRLPQPRAQVPPLRHDSSWNLPNNSEHHRCTAWQEDPSMLTSLQPLIRRCAITRHTTLVQNVCCVLDNPRKPRRVDGDRTPDSTRKIRKKDSCHLLN